jgi:uncharacterized UPF0160 family protein
MNFKSIIVHGGIFHADDAMAVAALRILLGDLPVSRRNPTPEELLDPSVLVVDVGGQLDPLRGNFDHHQTYAAPQTRIATTMLARWVEYTEGKFRLERDSQKSRFSTRRCLAWPFRPSSTLTSSGMPPWSHRRFGR